MSAFRTVLILSLCIQTILLRGQKPELVLPVGHTGCIVSSQFSPNGKLIATASSDNTAIIWETRSGKLIHTLRGHKDGVTSVSFSPDGQQILTSSFDKTAKIWDVTSGKLLHSLEGHTSFVYSAGYNHNGKNIVTNF